MGEGTLHPVEEVPSGGVVEENRGGEALVMDGRREGVHSEEVPFASREALMEAIDALRRKKNAVILAHFYQEPAIQDLADFVGDSLALAQYAHRSQAEIIVLCGVVFMAETAKILNPTRKVLIPDRYAGCSLVEACPPAAFRRWIDRYDPSERFVMVYINSSVEIKAMSDIVCTSSNALKLIQKVPEDKMLLFAPDEHLGRFLQRVSGRRRMEIWKGRCIVHEEFQADEVLALKRRYPGSKVIVHPECNEHLIEVADFVGSTSALLRFVQTDEAPVYIVGTEEGILHQMKRAAPHKEFILVPPITGCVACQQCPYMKMNTLEKLYWTLVREEPEIVIDEELLWRARRPLERMLAWTTAQ